MSRQSENSSRPSRRRFLGTSAAALAAGAAAAHFPIGLPIERSAHAAGGDLLRVGLIGCGGRGTGAATQALAADPGVKLTAMGDAFMDRLEESLAKLLQRPEIASKVDVKPEHRFAGFDAYRRVIESGVDVVLLAAPPHFRPLHLRAAVEAGKHVFAEKPVAVDAPGVRSVLATCEEARRRRLSVVSGLALRYSRGFQEIMKRIHDGAIGEPVAVMANDFRGPIWVKPRLEKWSDMEWQMRNWYYFTWLSGDFNVEQHVHFLDVCAWAMGGRYPARAIGTGGRQARTGPEYGNIYDHFSVVYEYEDGVRLFSNCRQQANCKNDISARVMGTKGAASIRQGNLAIAGSAPWKFEGPDNDLFQTEHDELFRSIREGKPIDNGEYMAKSTLLAILGRMAAYTGKQISWEEAMSSKEDLTPEKYEWGPIPAPQAAIPGVTKFI